MLYPFYYGGVCFLENLLSSTLIKFGTFWWHWVPLGQSFNKNLNMFPYTCVAQLLFSIGPSTISLSTWKRYFILKCFWGLHSLDWHCDLVGLPFKVDCGLLMSKCISAALSIGPLAINLSLSQPTNHQIVTHCWIVTTVWEHCPRGHQIHRLRKKPKFLLHSLHAALKPRNAWKFVIEQAQSRICFVSHPEWSILTLKRRGSSTWRETDSGWTKSCFPLRFITLCSLMQLLLPPNPE